MGGSIKLPEGHGVEICKNFAEGMHDRNRACLRKIFTALESIEARRQEASLAVNQVHR